MAMKCYLETTNLFFVEVRNKNKDISRNVFPFKDVKKCLSGFQDSPGMLWIGAVCP